ncbi:hypothetical protein ACF0H5_023932 [Mactra antiquata]
MTYMWINAKDDVTKWFWTLVILSVTPPVFSNTALLIIDVQNCFLPGGSLAVTNGDHVIPVINDIRRKYENQISLTVLSQDWHCQDHVSFASQHAGKQPLETITLDYDRNGHLCSNKTTCQVEYSLNQTLWPDHCVINSTGAEFGSRLDHKTDDVIVRKGYHCEIDSYSAFFDNGGFTKTELEDILNAHNITTVIVTGLALDFCVYYTSKDAKKLGFDVYMIKDASRPVIQQNVPTVIKDLESLGVHVIDSSSLVNFISSSSAATTCLTMSYIYISLLLTVLYLGI